MSQICGWKKKKFKMCKSQRSLVIILIMTMVVMVKILLDEKDILISDPISGGTDPDHCICLPSLTAIIILFHNAALSYSEIIINHTLIIKRNCQQSLSLVDVLPWQLDMTSQKEIRTEGLFAALNDCLYRFSSLSSP